MYTRQPIFGHSALGSNVRFIALERWRIKFHDDITLCILGFLFLEVLGDDRGPGVLATNFGVEVLELSYQQLLVPLGRGK